VVREGWGQGSEMTQALYAHMNNKTIKQKQKQNKTQAHRAHSYIVSLLFGSMTKKSSEDKAKIF
jgi:hypothetical protein